MEQPLPPYGACLLGSINLTKCVVDPFTANAYFDWDKYKRLIRIFTRMLDNVAEHNNLPLEKQREEILRKRRHGMGYLGLGSAMVMLGVSYGSSASVMFTETVSKHLALEGWLEGVELAKEKGPAPIFNEIFDYATGKELFCQSEYMKRVFDEIPDLKNQIIEHGCRFTHHSSIAPTGTIALSIGNNASNGIEPSFSHHYSRNVIKPGKSTKEKMDVYSYELLVYKKLGFTVDLDNLPKMFVDASNITPKEHVDIQAAAQYWIDSSISKTISIPTDMPFEDFKDVYWYGISKGLKGCTTFRFNPEVFTGVLVKDKDLENTTYQFNLEDGSTVSFKGTDTVMYDGSEHNVANLYDAIKEGYYGKH